MSDVCSTASDQCLSANGHGGGSDDDAVGVVGDLVDARHQPLDREEERLESSGQGDRKCDRGQGPVHHVADGADDGGAAGQN